MLYQILLVVVVIAALIGISSQEAERNAQSKRQQEQLDELCRQTGHPELCSHYVSPETAEQAARLKADGKMVAAVKVIRAATAMELLEAKQFVDQL
ncbi:MAG: 50S ribosomal protein L7/L12 [Clostridiales bacterium]|nr:50S ribosomal protein L7/L12 [Clostridiales bacterium]